MSETTAENKQLQLQVISAGAAKGLINQVGALIDSQYGYQLTGQFGAVGLMREKFLAPAPCDVLILSQAMMEALVLSGHVREGSVRPLGAVRTGVAYRDGDSPPKVSSPEELMQALVHAPGIYFPDPKKATAGIHFASVLHALKIQPDVEQRLHPHPNGAIAMRELADKGEVGALGCTQITEILYTSGVRLAGPLPDAFELSTVYSAGIPVTSEHPEAARHVIETITGPTTEEARRAGGFDPCA